MVPRKGFEPSTLRVWTACSSQLSYLGKLVAGAGFEPTTFGLWARRATGLLYPAIKYFKNIKWCLGPDLNRHGIKYHRILSPVRLPISPPRQINHLQFRTKNIIHYLHDYVNLIFYNFLELCTVVKHMLQKLRQNKSFYVFISFTHLVSYVS